jgi:hypothetical protein
LRRLVLPRLNMANTIVPTRLSCAKILAHEVESVATAAVNPLAYGRYATQMRQLLDVAKAQREAKEVVLRIEHFPPCPIFSSRAPAGNGYVQFKNVAHVGIGKSQVYLHRAAAMFRAYEQLSLSHREMLQFEQGKEASHLLVLPPNHSRRNFNPRYVALETGAYNKSRHFCA